MRTARLHGGSRGAAIRFHWTIGYPAGVATDGAVTMAGSNGSYGTMAAAPPPNEESGHGLP